ncbi:MAG: c-type cytochrome domain-containing protein [Chloroherpetonaceae bacterium]|nr:c-type cytochrome domain-containing protein [Chloroherpetonaceae bacterium]
MTSSPVTYARVRPILVARCVACHAQAALNHHALSGGLALDTLQAIRKGVVEQSRSRAVLVPGKSAQSALYLRLVTADPARRMPKGGPALKPQEIALIRQWIDAGAPGEELKGAPVAPTSTVAPMPASAGTQTIAIPTHMVPTADLVGKNTPKEARLALALGVGPLAPVAALAFSPDGQVLAVGGYRAVLLWSMTSGRPLGAITHLAGSVHALAFRPDGALLAAGSGEPGMLGEVRVFDVKTLKPVGPPLRKHTDTVFSVVWSADGTRLASGSQDRTARVYEWPSGKELYVFGEHSDAVARVAFTPDGNSLYTASHDRSIRHFQLSDGKLLRTISGEGEAITAMAVNPNGKFLVAAGTDPVLRWWNPQDGSKVNQMSGHRGPVNDLCFSQDGKFVVTAGADRTVQLWDGNAGGRHRAMEGAGDWIYSVAISPDGKVVAGGGADGRVCLWQADEGRLRLTLAFWPPDGQKTRTPDWFAITPEGYYDASPDWASRMQLRLGDDTVNAPRMRLFLASLRQPEKVLRALQVASLETATVPPQK